MSDQDSPQSDLKYPQEVLVVFKCPECGEELLADVPIYGGKAEVIRYRDIPKDDDFDADEPNDEE